MHKGGFAASRILGFKAFAEPFEKMANYVLG